jgi:hypothetical protein
MTHSIKLQCASAYRQIAALVLGLADGPETVAPEAWPLAKVNYLLLALWRSQDHPEAPLEAWGQRLASLDRLEEETAVAVHEIIPRFESVGLPLLAIKSFLPFPYVDSNLDLVASEPDRLPDYLAILHELGYRRYRNLADLREPMKQTFAVPGVGLRLHLHTAVSWNGVVYLPLTQVWARRRSWASAGGPVWIPAAEDELLIMAAHALFENKLVSLHELLYWYHLVTTDLDWGYVVTTARQFGWGRGLIHFMAIMNQLADLLDVPATTPLSLPPVPLASPAWLPYVFPLSQNWRITSHKLAQDIGQGLWRGVPRRLFSYLLVDHFWMYRKAFRKRREVTAVCS